MTENKSTTFSSSLIGDIFGGTAAMLVALPSAIAFGLIIYAPLIILNPGLSGNAAIGGIMGTIAIGLLASLLGGTNRLISAPCAPAAAVLSVFVADLVNKGSISPEIIPIYISIVALFAGAIQVILGKIGGGKFIKYIPYPVVAGYLSGVGVLIFMGQFPKFLGLSKAKFWESLSMYGEWKWESIGVGTVTIIAMFLAPKIIKVIPAAIIALLTGIACYFGFSLINSSMLNLTQNPFIIGPINATVSDLMGAFSNQITMLSSFDTSTIGVVFAPVLTLAVLLSIDTLKTCVVLDALTMTRHNSNKELVGQGIGNIGAALLCGIPGAGTMGATLVNLSSGGKTKLSGIFMGLNSLLVLLLLGSLIAWIPYAALAGILIVVAYRMIDTKSFALLKHKSTVFDFVVILMVVLSAVIFSLIAAAGVGIAMAILLFLREQMRTSVIRRKSFGNKTFSKKSRPREERLILEEKGKNTLVIELQGQLFFGTADQLLSEIEPVLADCKYAILDMHRVQSVDYTAANRLKQILARISEQKGFLIFASVPLSLPSGQHVKDYLVTLGLAETSHLKFFDALDFALEWVEDAILVESQISDDNSILELNEIEVFMGISENALKTLSSCLVEKSYGPNEPIFKMGDESDEMYFIRRGNVKIVLPLSAGMYHHLLTVTKGGFLGDMAFLDKHKRSADAVSIGNVQIYVLSRNKFNKITEEYPEVAGLFFEKLAQVIAQRLRQSNADMKELQEN